MTLRDVVDRVVTVQDADGRDLARLRDSARRH